MHKHSNIGTGDGETSSWTSYGENRQGLWQDKSDTEPNHSGGPTPHQNWLNPPQGHHTQKTKIKASSLSAASQVQEC